MVGVSSDRRFTSSFSRPLRELRPPWAKRVVKTIPLSVKVENGMPCSQSLLSGKKVVTTIGPVTGPVGGDREGVAGVVVPGEDLDIGAIRGGVGEVGLPGFVGFGLETDVGGLQFLLRLAVTRPWRRMIRS